jgi:hypothetical protein
MALLLENGGRLLLESGGVGLTVVKHAQAGIGEVAFIGVAPSTSKAAPSGIGLIEFVGIAPEIAGEAGSKIIGHLQFTIAVEGRLEFVPAVVHGSIEFGYAVEGRIE